MRTIKIADITLREAMINPDSDISFKNKIELAKLLDGLKTDVIETGAVSGGQTDALLIKTIASSINYSVLSCQTGLTSDEVEAAWNTIKDAKKPRLHIMVPVSTVQMEYLCHKKPPIVLKLIGELVAKAKTLCDDIEFSALDATRCEKQFLFDAVKTAIASGASTVTVCDTSGKMFPDEFKSFIEDLYKNVPELKNINLSVEVNNAISMACACSFSAVSAGAIQIKASVNDNDFTSLESIVKTIIARGDSCKISTNLKVTEFKRSISLMKELINEKRSESTPFDNKMGESRLSISLGIGDEISDVSKAVSELGYVLDENDISAVFEAVKRVIVKKQTVGEKELDAIVASVALQVPSTYKVESYVINSGNVITATADIQLEKDGKILQGVSFGDGPIDAAFLAIEQIIGHHYELDDFQIQSVTEGREAMGSSLVKLRSNGKVYAGKGISTDIIGASIRAYVSALNKIVNEEG